MCAAADPGNLSVLEVEVAAAQVDYSAARTAIAELWMHERRLNRDFQLLNEEAASLRIRFPLATIPQPKRVHDLVCTMRRYEETRLSVYLEKLQLKIDAAQAQMCSSQRDAQRTRDKIFSDDGFKQMSLSQRLELMDAINSSLGDAEVATLCQTKTREQLASSEYDKMTDTDGTMGSSEDKSRACPQ